jgi:hypothetical protein
LRKGVSCLLTHSIAFGGSTPKPASTKVLTILTHLHAHMHAHTHNTHLHAPPFLSFGCLLWCWQVFFHRDEAPPKAVDPRAENMKAALRAHKSNGDTPNPKGKKGENFCCCKIHKVAKRSFFDALAWQRDNKKGLVGVSRSRQGEGDPFDRRHGGRAPPLGCSVPENLRRGLPQVHVQGGVRSHGGGP